MGEHESFDRWEAVREGLQAKLDRWVAGERVRFSTEEREAIREMVHSTYVAQAELEVSRGIVLQTEHVREQYEAARAEGAKPREVVRPVVEGLGWERLGGVRRGGFDAAGVVGRFLPSFWPEERQLRPSTEAIYQLAGEFNVEPATVLRRLQDHRAELRRQLSPDATGMIARVVAVLDRLPDREEL